MKLRSISKGIGMWEFTLALATTLAFVSGSSARQTADLKQNPKEVADYKAFSATKDIDKKIRLGKDFLRQYPAGPDGSAVYTELVRDYYVKQDLNDFYATANEAVSKYPDDVDVLTVVGWAIPHVSISNDPDASKKLDDAEKFEKRAIELISNLSKPANLTADEFATAQDNRLSKAHSGLGLVYYRRQNYQESVKELHPATQGIATPDPVDYYVLGSELQNLGRFSEAFDAFEKCGSFPGALQDRCKQGAEQAKNNATSTK